MNKVVSAVKNPAKILMSIMCRTPRLWKDSLYLKVKYKCKFGHWPDLNNPKTFNEKLQWLKLHDRRPEYTMMVDKVKAKDYVASIIGDEYIIPTLGIWEKVEDIDFSSLPDKFVIKCNHNSGTGMYICTDKSKMDERKVRAELQKGLNEDFYLTGREWPYKNVPRRIIAEQFLEDKKEPDLKDYKLMCFDGQVYCTFVCSDRRGDGLKINFFDKDWNPLPFERHYPRSDKKIERPHSYEKMVGLAEKLSKKIPFVRVDFYEVDGHLYFGELTFYPGSGLEEFSPEEWDEKLGKLINLPEWGGVFDR